MNSASVSTSDAESMEVSEPVIHRKYLPHIDGLRCLAVIPVVLYHLAGPICPGGFVGVDIFFVISGYLIYGGILEDLRQGKFSMVTFYHRRIRRIFPAYFVLVCATLLAGIGIYYWSRIIVLAQTALSSAFFSTNIYFWMLMGYFQPNANENPLLHLWTLGVEEQFYFIIPILTLVLWKISRTHLTLALVLIFLLSLVLCLALGRTGNSTTAFYLLPSRAWELMAGALLANVANRPKSIRTNLLPLLGLALILNSFWCLDTTRTFTHGGTSVEVILPFIGSLGIYPFPGYPTLPVVIGSLLLIQYGSGGWMGRILCSAPFTAIGKISYSLYLWHWPIIVYARYIQYGHQTPWALALIFLSFFPISYLSWKWLEMPIRRSKRFTPGVAFTFLGAGCAFVAGACLLLVHTQGLRNYIHTRANYFSVPPRPFSETYEKLTHPIPFRPPPYPLLDDNYVKVIGEPGQKPTFCLLGDSHAHALAPGLDRVAREHHQTGLYIAKKLIPHVNEMSQDLDAKLIEWVGNNPDIHDVYLLGRWPQEYRIEEGIRKLGETAPLKPYTLDAQTMDSIAKHFQHTAEWFIQHGKRVFVFSDVPDYDYFPADLMARSQMFPLNYAIAISREDYDIRERPFTEVFAALESKGLITVIPLQKALISGDQCIYMSPEGRPYYQDLDHLTPEGAYVVTEAVAPLLWPTKSPVMPGN